MISVSWDPLFAGRKNAFLFKAPAGSAARSWGQQHWSLALIYLAIIGPANQKIRRLAQKVLDAVPEEDGL